MGQSTLLKPAWAPTGSTRRRRHHPRQPSQTLNYAALRSDATAGSGLEAVVAIWTIGAERTAHRSGCMQGEPG